MSGAEVVTTVQLIDACIGITRTIVEIAEAARDAKGLPDRLRELFERLPAIEDVLELARENHGNVPNEERQSVKPMLKQCNTSLEELRMLLWKACPEDGENYGKRVVRGTKTVLFGRENKLLRLLDTILVNLKLLEQMKLYDIGDRLQSLSETVQSLAEDEGSSYYNTYKGSGDQNIHQGSGNMYNQRGGDNSTFHQNFAAPLTKMDDRCLQSLAFPDMETRGDIGPKTDQTCEWISQHAKYLKWNREGGLLWIKGRPGTGKSTLMEYLRKVTPPDSSNVGDGETLVLSFFFHRRGHELQKTPLGLFRSLLHQILRVDQELLSQFMIDTGFETRCRVEGEPGKDKKWDWTASVLQELLSDYVPRASGARQLRLYIDALDESGEKAARGLMEHLALLQTRAGGRLKTCVSCRPWPDVVHGWQYCIDVAEENSRDIKQFLCEKLSKWSTSSVEIEEEIANRALGVFQWAVIIVDRVLSLGEADPAIVLAHIRNTPMDLDGLYDKLLSQLSRIEKKEALRVFRWITFAREPLTLTELRYAVAIEMDSELRSSEDCKSSAHWCDSDEQMRAKVQRMSFGMAKFQHGVTVQFDHESVYDYMLTRGIPFLENKMSEQHTAMTVYGSSDVILSSVCFRYLVSLDPEEESVYDSSWDRFPFESYASDYAWAHASNAESLGYSVEYILKITKWPKTIRAYSDESLDPSGSSAEQPFVETLKLYPFSGEVLTVQHCAAYYGLSGLIRCLIPKMSKDSRIVNRIRNRADAIDVRDPAGRTPFWYAASQGHTSVVQLLLSTRRVEVNAKDLDEASPFWTAAEQGRHNVILSLLQNKKVDVEAKDDVGRTPFAIAACNGHENVVQLLLKHEMVNVESRDNLGRSPLFSAARNNHVSTMRLLLADERVNPETRDKNDRTPLFGAAQFGSVEAVMVLLKIGAVDPNARDDEGCTPLEAAASHGYLNVVMLLLDTDRVDVNATLSDYHHATSLSQAAQRGDEEMVKALLRNGKVDTNARVMFEPDQWLTPLEIAEKKEHHGIVNILQEYEEERGSQ